MGVAMVSESYEGNGRNSVKKMEKDKEECQSEKMEKDKEG